ncbi:hypothetical protein Acr_23g0000740 [Actinidia rufa]|uniref:Uncharacterized protein n=1 Tax=Actinidia rufa TaxID=165716 RepID=A0A7J0GLI7_9ERIC|nr:hypothetical protein Acr_23g0000740 [Actinidia rufa]
MSERGTDSVPVVVDSVPVVMDSVPSVPMVVDSVSVVDSGEEEEREGGRSGPWWWRIRCRWWWPTAGLRERGVIETGDRVRPISESH